MEKAKFAKHLFSHLRNYHEDSSIEISLHNALCDIEILFSKQLYAFCFEVINHHLDISIKYQMYELTLLLTKWKRKCLSRLDNIKLTKSHLKDLNAIDALCNLQINMIFKLKFVQQEILQIINKKGTSFAEDDRKKSLQLLSQLDIDVSQIHSLTAFAIYNEINSWIAYYVHDNNILALQYNTANYEMFKKSKHLIAVFPQMFLSVYYSYYKRSFLNNSVNTPQVLKEIKALQTTNKINIPEDVRVQAFMLSSEVEMLENIHYKKFEDALNLYAQNKKYLTKHSHYIKKYYLLINNYCLALAHFHLKEYTQALYYTKKNIDNFNDSIRLDYYMYNLTLNFIIHIELENVSIYKYLNSAYKRALKKHRLTNTEEEIYGQFFEQITHLKKPTAELCLKTFEALQDFASISNKGSYELHVNKWFLEKQMQLKN